MPMTTSELIEGLDKTASELEALAVGDVKVASDMGVLVGQAKQASASFVNELAKTLGLEE